MSVPEATQKATRGPLKGTASTPKPFQGSRTETREEGGGEENRVSYYRGYWFALKTIIFFNKMDTEKIEFETWYMYFPQNLSRTTAFLLLLLNIDQCTKHFFTERSKFLFISYFNYLSLFFICIKYRLIKKWRYFASNKICIFFGFFKYSLGDARC